MEAESQISISSDSLGAVTHILNHWHLHLEYYPPQKVQALYACDPNRAQTFNKNPLPQTLPLDPLEIHLVYLITYYTCHLRVALKEKPFAQKNIFWGEKNIIQTTP